MARQLGELEAQKELDDMTLKLQATREKSPQRPQMGTGQAVALASDTDAAKLADGLPNAHRGGND
jgi:hypothetical protein